MARTIQINYGTFSVGVAPTDARIVLTDKFNLEVNYEAFVCEFRVHILGGTSAGLAAAETALFNAVRDIDVAFSIKTGGVTRFIADPSANSGFLTRARCYKPGDAADTAVSSMWDVEIKGSLPASKTGRNARRNAVVSISETPSERQRAVFEGEYTALSANDAYAQYSSNVTTWITSVLAGFGAGWQRAGPRQWRFEDQTKVLTFREEYEKIHLNESAAALDHPAIVNPNITLSITRPPNIRAAAYRNDTEPLRLFRISYTADIKISQLSGSVDLQSLYLTTIKPYLISLIGLGGVAITGDTFSPDLTENKVSAVLEGFILRTGLLEAQVVLSTILRPGRRIYPRWNGNPFARDVYQGIATEIIVADTFVRFTGAAPPIRGLPSSIKEPAWTPVEIFSNKFDTAMGDNSPILVTNFRRVQTWTRTDRDPHNVGTAPPTAADRTTSSNGIGGGFLRPDPPGQADGSAPVPIIPLPVADIISRTGSGLGPAGVGGITGALP